MKTITCRQMGGDCDAPISANTPDEMMKAAMEHLEKAHPEMATSVKAMPETDPKMVQWQKDFEATWAATPNL